jgi:hypothetical protein
MTQVVAVSKIGMDVEESTDPNDFVFHSEYNTFKIILEGTKQVTLAASTSNQSFTQAHFLDFIPLMTAFAKEPSKDQVFLPNSQNVNSYGVDSGWDGTGVTFNYVSATATNMIFNFDNDNGTPQLVNIKYYILEKVAD